MVLVKSHQAELPGHSIMKAQMLLETVFVKWYERGAARARGSVRERAWVSVREFVASAHEYTLKHT